MKIIVLVKEVPDTAQLSATVDGLALLADGPRIINPWDEYAVETGLQLKETHGGQVVALSMGRPEAVEVLKRCLAMGADEAILVSDPALENSDTLATARVLAAAIQKIGGADLVIAGRSGIDGNTGATAVQVAALLNLPQLSYVAAIKEVDPQARQITVTRLVDDGRETVRSPLPAVMSVVKEINEPRYPNLIGLRRASRATIPTWGLADLGLSPEQVGTAGAQVRWAELSLPPGQSAQVEMIDGSPAEAAKKLVDRLIAEKIL